MPLPGGATDKFGNRYEGRWTVACMIEIMDENADAIRLEPLGAEGEGVEFWVGKGNSREYHQVKRQLSASGRWTLAELGSKDILSNFWEKLKIPTASCTFVSTHAAFQLEELADRARRAASWQEFEQEFLNASKSQTSEQLRNFQELCRRWNNCPQIQAYDTLKRIEVETVGENTLLTIIESRIATLVEGDSATVADVLAQLVLDKVHHELTAHDIWHHLENRGFRRRQWGKDPHVLAAVEDTNKLYLSPLQDAAITRQVIPRDEAQTVLQKLTATNSKRGVLLSGEAGVGKSGVMLQVLEALRDQGLPTLAFRIDRLEPTLLPNDVGQQLGLPGSPANVLAAIAQKRDCVLIIDQLDAVSLASGRNPQFFDCVAEVIKQAQAHSRMRLVLACRKFDLDNDHRLRRLTGEDGIAEIVTISHLPHPTVQRVVAELGLDATRLNGKQLDLLSIPLHLRLLAEVAEDSTIDALNFKTVRDLYYHFWDYKQAIIEHERLGRPVQWNCVIDALCEHISHRQILSAPEDIIENWRSDAKAMVSEHVLIRDGKKYSFFHEGFFDYAFARRFAARGHKLMPFLQSSEQHLFRRAQVRQILLHEREADFEEYLDNLKELLTSSDIRFHLKQVVLALLGTLNDPTEEEWNIITLLMGDPAAPLTQQVWLTLRSSIHWFQLLDSLGIIEQWLTDESEERIDQTVKLLSIMQRQIPNRVSELVEPYVSASEAWRNWLMYLMQRGDLDAGRRFFDLFLRLIDKGILDEARGPIKVNRDFWIIYSLPEKHPEWTCELISHYLHRCLYLYQVQLITWLIVYCYLLMANSYLLMKYRRLAGRTNPFDRNTGTIANSTYSNEVFMESARAAPKAFVSQVLPFIICVLELTTERRDDPPWSDLIWTYPLKVIGHNNIEDALLEAMEAALSALVVNKSDVLADVMEQLKSLNFEIAQYLLICMYAADGKRFADEAADYLCEQPARLRIKYSRHAHWSPRQLLEAITPYCSNERLARLERVILNYYPDWEKKAGIHHSHGYAQFILLEGITPSRHSETVSRRLDEWRRKFGQQPIEVSRRITVARDTPPAIPGSAAEKMTNKQWLNAIAEYGLDKEYRGNYGRLVNARAVPSLLENQVKKEPGRFAELVWEFPDSTHPDYFDAVLRGIADVGLDVQTALRVCQRCHQLPQRPCGRWICWLIQKLAELPWLPAALDIVICYALNDPNPEQELWRTETPNGQVYYGGDVLSAGINSTRGSAVNAIAQLIYTDKNCASYFQLPLQQIVRDPSIAVRACAAEALTAVLNYDRDLAVSLFQPLCQTEDALLETRTVEHFLYYALPTHFQELASIVERMIMSELPEVVKVGARQACLTSLVIEEANLLADLCLSGTEAHRTAAAEIFVTNLRQAQLRKFCENALVQLFDDSSQNVRSQAARCFFQFEGEQLGDYVSLVEAFVESPAFTTDHEDLIYALEKTTAKLPDVTYLVCERFINAVSSTAADIRTRSAADANTISQLLVRVYRQSKDQALQSRCLDLIDRMAQMEVYGLAEALTQYER